jgi:hypothetical protein
MATGRPVDAGDEQARLTARDLQRFDLKYRLGDARHHSVDGSVLVRLGSFPAVITAPHSAPTVRNGKPKATEFYTGAWAELIAMHIDCTAVTLLRPHATARTAEETVMGVVERVGPVVRPEFVFDIHGMSPRHGLDICFGASRREASPAVELADLLSDRFQVSVDKPFSGGAHTLSGWASRALPGARVCQVELGPRLRSDMTTNTDIAEFLDAVAKVMSPGNSESHAPEATR